MASGPAVRGYMIFICLGGLVQMLQYCGRPEGTTGPDLIGRSTSNELVREVRLVLWAVLVLDPQLRSTPHSTRCKGQAYLIVSLRALVVVAVPTHDDDLCKVWAGKLEVEIR